MAKATIDQGLMFSFTFEACRAQFELRNHDAHENVSRIRDKYLENAKGARSGTSQQSFHAECAAALTELIQEFKNKNFEHQQGAETPESRVRGRSKEGSVERLVRTKKLDGRQGAAALEIARIYEGVIGALTSRARKLDGMRVDGGLPWDPVRMSEWMADKHLFVYRPWCATVVKWKRGPRVMALLQDVICLGMPLDAARRRWSFTYQNAFYYLRSALDLFADLDEEYVPPEPDDGGEGIPPGRGSRAG